MQMTSARERFTLPAVAAYVGALLFALHLPTYLVPAIRDATPASAPLVSALNALLAVAEHLVLFSVVAALPAPRWGKRAGYAWLVVDIVTDLLQLGGVTKAIYLSARCGANIASAIWIASASWRASRGMRTIGLVNASTLTLYSCTFFVPFAFVLLLPSLVLLPWWLVLAGRRLSRQAPAESARRGPIEGAATAPLYVR